MNVKPVKAYKMPAYPDREKVQLNPEILSRMPKRWQTNVLLTAVLSSTLMVTTTSCQKVISRSANPQSFKIAPIFVHGDGVRTQDLGGNVKVRPQQSPPAESFDKIKASDVSYDIEPSIMLLGTTSQKPKTILVGNGPLFWPSGMENEAMNSYIGMSEEEALSIINDEVSKAGLNFDTYVGKSEDLMQIDVTDGYDTKEKLGFEFVSVSDAEEIDTADTKNNVRSSVDDNTVIVEFDNPKVYKLLDTAQQLRKDKDKNQMEMNMGIFYDPGEGQFEGDKFISSEDLLRRQVSDFIEWLRNEGIV